MIISQGHVNRTLNIETIQKLFSIEMLILPEKCAFLYTLFQLQLTTSSECLTRHIGLSQKNIQNFLISTEFRPAPEILPVSR